VTQLVADLRSDTVTKPTPGMRDAMARAEVGDDVYGEDPTARALEEQVASLLGKESALFVPSGTMGNQLGLLCHTRRGDEVVVGEGAHVAFYESGAGPAWSGVQFAFAGRGGLFSADEARACFRGKEYYLPQTSLVCVENTHNRAGGRVFPQGDVLAISAAARAVGLALHLDGARLWNASIATGLAPRELAEPFDTVTVCFSKGLGAPVGSVLAGSRELIQRAHRFRKMLGGGMRQIGVLAAACQYALAHHVERLALDHEAARALATRLAEVEGLEVPPPETNVVMLRLRSPVAPRAVALAAERGVRISAFDADRLRAVLHLDVASAALPAASSILAWACETALAEPTEPTEAR
jgi:threonine aldolase